MATQITEHFTFEEMTVSGDHPELLAVNRQDASNYRWSLETLCQTLLEPLRSKFGPLRVSSGFRCLSLNRALPGSPTSQHMRGQAADVNHFEDTTDAKRVEMARWLDEEFKAGRLKFGQALIERECLHVSLPGTHLGQVGRASYAGGWHVEPLEASDGSA